MTDHHQRRRRRRSSHGRPPYTNLGVGLFVPVLLLLGCCFFFFLPFTTHVAAAAADSYYSENEERQPGNANSNSNTNTAQFLPTSREKCYPCYDPNEVPDMDHGACEELSRRSTRFYAGTPQCLASQLENFQSYCCIQPPHEYCTLCGGSSDNDSSTTTIYNPTRIVPNFDPNGDDLTCKDLQDDTTYTDYLFQPGKCEDTLLQRSSAWCGCRHGRGGGGGSAPEVQEEGEMCTLCQDGRRPKYLDRIETVYYGWNCAAFEYVASMFNENECQDLTRNILEFDAASFCGCNNDHDSDHENHNVVCSLCDDHEELINHHSKVGEDGADYTCQELVESTSFIPTIETCIKVKQNYYEDGSHHKCCGLKKGWNADGSKKQNDLGSLRKKRRSPFVFWTGAVVLPIVLVVAGLTYYFWD